jgi:excisionase family DNA binding protein
MRSTEKPADGTTSYSVGGIQMDLKDATKTPPHTGPAKVMTVRELSAYLQLHPTTVYRLLKRREIPAFRMGSDWRFNIEAIDRWRLQQTNPDRAPG